MAIREWRGELQASFANCNSIADSSVADSELQIRPRARSSSLQVHGGARICTASADRIGGYRFCAKANSKTMKSEEETGDGEMVVATTM